jgi:hypothetical protein
VITLKADGSGSPQTIVPEQYRNGIFGVAWDNAPRQPNYYIKHVEVAQAIGTPLVLPAVVPLSSLPLTETWSEPAAGPLGSYPVKLVAGSRRWCACTWATRCCSRGNRLL